MNDATKTPKPDTTEVLQGILSAATPGVMGWLDVVAGEDTPARTLYDSLKAAKEGPCASA